MPMSPVTSTQLLSEECPAVHPLLVHDTNALRKQSLKTVVQKEQVVYAAWWEGCGIGTLVFNKSMGIIWDPVRITVPTPILWGSYSYSYSHSHEHSNTTHIPMGIPFPCTPLVTRNCKIAVHNCNAFTILTILTTHQCISSDCWNSTISRRHENDCCCEHPSLCVYIDRYLSHDHCIPHRPARSHQFRVRISCTTSDRCNCK